MSDPDAAGNLARACVAGRIAGAEQLFKTAPCLGVWATLTPLAAGYGASDREVYRHLADALGLDLDTTPIRERFKSAYRNAARHMGIALAGNTPTALFFAPLGVADAQLDPLAEALLTALDRLGPPATEDTPSTVAWQRRSLAWCPESLTRLRAAVAFDKIGHYALRSERWRRREVQDGARDAALFDALDRAERRLGIQRERIVAEPCLVWVRDALALQAQPSELAQTVHAGAFPKRLVAGQPLELETPWPATLGWSVRHRYRDVPIAPRDDEALLFDADTGLLVARQVVGTSDPGIDVAPPRLIVLAREAFDATGFGQAIPAADPACRLAWVDLDPEVVLVFPGGRTLTLRRARDPGLRVEGGVLGRDGTRLLRAADGALAVQLDPTLPDLRLLRVTAGDAVRHRDLVLDADGRARVPLETLGFAAEGDPVCAVFEILVLGADRTREARAEVRTACEIWPGVAAPDRLGGLDAPRPSTLDVTRSRGLAFDGPRLRLDPDADGDVAVMAVTVDGALRSYAMPHAGVRLWHLETDSKARRRVPRGAHLLFGHAQRQDTLRVDAPGLRAHLRVLGRRHPAPFLGRSSYALGVEALAPGTDDRILVEHEDGTRELLARLIRVDEPSAPEVLTAPGRVALRLRPPAGADALGWRVDALGAPPEEGALPLAGRPVPGRPPAGLDLTQEADGAWRLSLDLDPARGPGRARVLWRHAEAQDLDLLRDAGRRPYAVGFAGPMPAPDAGALASLAQWLAEPSAPSLTQALEAPLVPLHRAALERLGTQGFLRPILPTLMVRTEDGGVARHDVLTGAPWLFGADLHAFHALDGHPDLAPLARMAALPSPTRLPRPDAEDPFGDWLGLLASGDGLPRALDADALSGAFAALRARLADPRHADLSGTGALAGALRLVSEVHVEHLERLRDFDRAMGSDLKAARLVALLDRFARAARQGRGQPFLAALAARTGLGDDEVGQALSVAVRLGIEAFAQSLVLWHHAVHACPGDRR